MRRDLSEQKMFERRGLLFSKRLSMTKEKKEGHPGQSKVKGRVAIQEVRIVG